MSEFRASKDNKVQRLTRLTNHEETSVPHAQPSIHYRQVYRVGV